MKKYQFLKNIISLPCVQTVILFGSRAREDHKERSDIDVAIDCKEATQNDWLKIIDLVDKADTLLHIDCIRLDTLDDNDKLKQNIIRQGKIIYSKNMNKDNWFDSLETLGNAIVKLREGVDKAETKQEELAIYRDATIQRFEFTVELFWKVLKRFLNYEQFNVNTPREVLKKSYEMHLINNEEVWLNMMNDRNLTSHTYKENLAKEIFRRISGLYLPLLEDTYKTLQQKYLGTVI